MRMNVFGKWTPTSPATAKVMTTGSQMRPRNALGKPSKLDCHETATFPQEMMALILQASFESGFFASSIASIERTRDAVMLAIEETSIVIKVPRCRTVLSAVSISLTGSSNRSLCSSASLPGEVEIHALRLCDKNRTLRKTQKVAIYQGFWSFFNRC